MPLLVAAVVAVVFAAAGVGARANQQTLFLVRDVPAKGEGKTDAAAQRSAAFRSAAKALRQLLRRVTARRDHRRLPRVSARNAHAMIKGLEVVRAKRLGSDKGRSFDGALSFLFDPEKVGALLEARGIGWSDKRSAPVLVLPVWTADGGLKLWDGPNPWRDAWEARKAEPGLVPIILPDGSVQDLQAIDAAQTAKRDTKALEVIAKKYEAQQVLVTVARKDDRGRARVAVWLYSLRNGTVDKLESVIRRGENGLERAVASLASRLTERWKAQVIVPAGPVRATNVVAQFDGIEAWTRIQESLDAAPAVTGYKVVRFSAGDAFLTLSHKGTPDSLPALLRAFGLRLTRTQSGWLLRAAPKPKSSTE